MGGAGISKQKCKSKLLDKLFFAAVILYNFPSLDCYRQKTVSGIQENIKSPHDDFFTEISQLSVRSSSENYERKSSVNRNSDALVRKPHRSRSSKYPFEKDVRDSGIKGVATTSQTVKKAVQRKPDFYFLTTISNDGARGSTFGTANEEKLALQLYAENTIKMPTLLPGGTILSRDRLSGQRQIGKSTGLGQSHMVDHNPDEVEHATEIKSILVNRLTKEHDDKENEMLAVKEHKPVTKSKEHLSIQNIMNSSADFAESLHDLIIGELPLDKNGISSSTDNNQEQKDFSAYMFANTNHIDINDTNNKSRFGESEILTPEANNDTAILSIVGILYDKYPVGVWKSVGLFDDTYIEKGINPHWIRFDPPNPAIHDILAVLYSLIMFVGCSGNFLVVYMFARCRSLRTPANYLIANLAISDFFMLAKTPIFIFNSIYRGPALGSIGCKIYGFVGGLTGTASIMTLTAIALDRYYAIVHPLNPFKRTSTRTNLMIASIWIYSGIFSGIPLLGLNGYVSEGYLTSCSFDYLSPDIRSRIFVFVFFVGAWLFPLSVIVFSYVQIFRMVVQAEKFRMSVNTKESFKDKKNQSKQQTEIKIAIVTSGVITLWILSWSPYAIVALLGIFGKKEYITPFVSAVPALFCKTASCIDPIIYSISHPRFQRELKAKFKMCFPTSRNFPTRSLRDNSFVTYRVSPSAQTSLSENLCSGAVPCGLVSLKGNCPCIERTRSHRQKSLEQTKTREINKENIVTEEIEMRQVRLERLESKDFNPKVINVEFSDQHCNKTVPEDNKVLVHIKESSDSCRCRSEQQEIILHVCSSTESSQEGKIGELETATHNKSKRNGLKIDSEDSNQSNQTTQ